VVCNVTGVMARISKGQQIEGGGVWVVDRGVCAVGRGRFCKSARAQVIVSPTILGVRRVGCIYERM